MSSSSLKTQAQDSLGALLLPLGDRQLLVPNSVVAELVPYRAPRAMPDMPGWVLGQIDWRDLRLPLLCFELACGARLVAGEQPRIAVLNALGGREHVKFIALLLQGIPRSVRVDAALPRHPAPLASLELEAVRVDEQEARIPDLIALEDKLAQAGLI